MSDIAVAQEHQPQSGFARPITAAASLAALGIVYGDLGTSPLYTTPAIIDGVGGNFSPEIGLGILSLIFWALIITVSIKYCLLVMRADNHGEGGILALMSLVAGRGYGRVPALVMMGLFGAALIYGDGIITPAISVLSALEGVNVASDALKPYVMPLSVAILIALFAVQNRGTARIGRVFGPVMLGWFVVIGILGIGGIVRHPEVAKAVDPTYGIVFLVKHGWQGFGILGGVFLALTGGEALYADMGHVGRGPVRLTWYGIVLPALLLNYAGQIALLIAEPGQGSPFFRLAPDWAVYPMVILATAATIIASQAIITGSFSLTRQAMQLGWFPGFKIRQTSDTEYGQIYVPVINWLMMVMTVVLTVSFGSSDRLAGAYGTAVSLTMMLTTTLLYNLMRQRWHWPVLLAAAAALFAGERLDGLSWLALCGSTVGAAMVVMGGSRGSAGRETPTLAGDLLVIVSLISALGWILLTKKLMETHSPPVVTAYTIYSGTAMLIAWMAGSWLFAQVLREKTAPFPFAHVSATAWAALAISGVFCTATTTLLWNWGIHHVPASRAGVFLNIEPALGSILGVGLLGEKMGPFAWLGGVLILAGAVTLTTRGREAEPEVILE